MSLRDAPPLPARPREWAWPDPPGKSHPCDRDALDAIERAAICLKHGDRLGCLRALAEYEFLCHCGVERPDFESRVRAMFAQLGGTPAGHEVPAAVETLEELLAVFAFNQDSPSRTYHIGGGWHYCDAKRGERDGSVRLEWRVSALVNYGRTPPPSHAGRVRGTEGSHVVWDGGEFARSPADRRGQPKTPEHHRAMAENSLLKWACVLAFAGRAAAYGWELGNRDDYETTIREMCERAGVDFATPPPVPADLFVRRAKKETPRKPARKSRRKPADGV